jgi:sensor histidine kinase regulating citrate/malate metabolism
MAEREKREIRVRTLVEDQKAEILVEDTGPGVPPEMESLLFVQTIQREEHEGMGLHLVGFLVEQYGGSVRLKWNHPDQGACFSFTLPLLPAPGKRQ